MMCVSVDVNVKTCLIVVDRFNVAREHEVDSKGDADDRDGNICIP